MNGRLFVREDVELLSIARTTIATSSTLQNGAGEIAVHVVLIRYCGDASPPP
jgi:hypothetical protein